MFGNFPRDKYHFIFTLVLVMALGTCLFSRSSLAEETFKIMALPDWAYGERQRLSPILVKGEVISVSCHGVQCALKMKILEVLRNQSSRDIVPGQVVSIVFVGRLPSESHKDSSPPPPIGAPDISVELPKIGETKNAWLRSANDNSEAYELMVGAYGFGPNLEESK